MILDKIIELTVIVAAGIIGTVFVLNIAVAGAWLTVSLVNLLTSKELDNE